MPESSELHINEEKLRFELSSEGLTAWVDYRWYKGSLALIHIYVPPELRSKAISESLARQVLDHAASHKLKIMVYCSYIAKFIKAHPEYAPLRDERYHQI